MRKGNLELDKLFGLVLAVLVLVIVAYAFYYWINNGSSSLGEVLRLPAGVG